MEYKNLPKIYYDCYYVSGGTIATLINRNLYDIVNAVHHDWLSFVLAEHVNHNWKHWQNAWDSYSTCNDRIERIVNQNDYIINNYPA